MSAASLPSAAKRPSWVWKRSPRACTRSRVLTNSSATWSCLTRAAVMASMSAWMWPCTRAWLSADWFTAVAAFSRLRSEVSGVRCAESASASKRASSSSSACTAAFSAESPGFVFVTRAAYHLCIVARHEGMAFRGSGARRRTVAGGNASVRLRGHGAARAPRRLRRLQGRQMDRLCRRARRRRGEQDDLGAVADAGRQVVAGVSAHRGDEEGSRAAFFARRAARGVHQRSRRRATVLPPQSRGRRAAEADVDGRRLRRANLEPRRKVPARGERSVARVQGRGVQQAHARARRQEQSEGATRRAPPISALGRLARRQAQPPVPRRRRDRRGARSDAGQLGRADVLARRRA